MKRPSARSSARPHDPQCSAGVIFFNTEGYLGMCGHGTIGLAVTLAHIGRLTPGEHLVETPVGIVRINLINPHEVRVDNVESYCFRRDVQVDVVGLGPVYGAVAWGGNWFFLCRDAPYELSRENAPLLSDIAWRIRRALTASDITGADGAEIDHIEFFGPPSTPEANSRNFVLCPGGAYDRSPCGTGTSAKLALLAATGELAPGEVWVQESLIGSRFRAEYREADTPGRIAPTITGSAFITAEATLRFEEGDPFRWGVR